MMGDQSLIRPAYETQEKLSRYLLQNRQYRKVVKMFYNSGYKAGMRKRFPQWICKNATTKN